MVEYLDLLHGLLSVLRRFGASRGRRQLREYVISPDAAGRTDRQVAQLCGASRLWIRRLLLDITLRRRRRHNFLRALL